MPVEPGEPWGAHATLRVDSTMTGGRLVVRCDGCWTLFAIGPRVARKSEAMF